MEIPEIPLESSLVATKTKEQLEADKLQAEIDELDSQVALNEQIKKFNNMDRRWCSWSRGKDLITIVVSVAPMLAVIIALLTLKADQEKDVVRSRDALEPGRP